MVGVLWPGLHHSGYQLSEQAARRGPGAARPWPVRQHRLHPAPADFTFLSHSMGGRLTLEAVAGPAHAVVKQARLLANRAGLAALTASAPPRSDGLIAGMMKSRAAAPTIEMASSGVRLLGRHVEHVGSPRPRASALGGLATDRRAIELAALPSPSNGRCAETDPSPAGSMQAMAASNWRSSRSRAPGHRPDPWRWRDGHRQGRRSAPRSMGFRGSTASPPELSTASVAIGLVCRVQPRQPAASASSARRARPESLARRAAAGVDIADRALVLGAGIGMRPRRNLRATSWSITRSPY